MIVVSIQDSIDCRNTLWACAKVDHLDAQLFNEVAIHICRLETLNNFSLQSVATLVWAAAKVGCYNEALFDKIASYCVHDKNLLTTEANKKNISMLIWAYATVESNHPVLFESLTEHVLALDNLDSFDSFALTNLIWGLNQFTTPPRELLYKVIDAAVHRGEGKALVQINSSLFPDRKEICLAESSKCTDAECEKLHLDHNPNLLEILIKHRYEKLFEKGMYSGFYIFCHVFHCINLIYTVLIQLNTEDEAIGEETTEEEVTGEEAISGDSLSEEDESEPVAIASLGIQDDSTSVDQLKYQVESYLKEKESKREQMPSFGEIDKSSVDDAGKAKMAAEKNGVSKPSRKTDKKDPTKFGYTSELQYDKMRYTLILSLIKSEFAAKVPLLTEQCVRVLLLVSPHDLHVIWLNHCATQYAGSKGHCNLHAGNGCREGYDMQNCASVIAMIAIAEYFAQFTDIEFDDVVKHVQCANLFEFCLTNGSKFQRCAVGTEEETDPLVGIINLFLDALSKLKVYTIVASSAGRTCGIEELVLKKLQRPSRYIMICRKTLWHLQFNVVKHHAKSEQESAQIVTRLWEIFCSRFLTPSLESAGKAVIKTLADVLKDNAQLLFVSHDPTKLDDEIESSDYLSKEEYVRNLLTAMVNILKADEDAQAEDQVYIVQRYAQNHYAEIKERLGNDAPTSWQHLYVRDLLINMGRNGWNARIEKYGREEVLKQCSAAGQDGWDARIEKYGLEEVLKQCSAAGQDGWDAKLEKYGLEEVLKQCSAAGQVTGARNKEAAEERKQGLTQLAETGEPFWVRADQDGIIAGFGKPLLRAWRGKTSHNFPRIQESHGQYKEVVKLRYKKCPLGDNVVVEDYAYTSFLSSRIKIKGYRIRIPYGMFSMKKENGNAILCWYEKKM
jgi:hypothetical protein